jgi:DNA-binding NtrC family response regulator
VILEDAGFMKDFLKEALTYFGYSATFATDTTTAMAELNRNIYDLIILDIEKQVLFESKAVSTIHALNTKLPVLVITTDNSLDMEKQVRNQGAYYCLIKPFGIEQMRQVIETAVSAQKN